MDREAFTETIKAFKHRTPFQPFTVATVNGNRYEVDFPDALAVREGLAIFVGLGRFRYSSTMKGSVRSSAIFPAAERRRADPG